LVRFSSTFFAKCGKILWESIPIIPAQPAVKQGISWSFRIRV
jgi:hypothetical protein